MSSSSDTFGNLPTSSLTPILSSTASYLIVQKPFGLPLSGTKPLTLQSLHPTLHITLSPPRQLLGPALLTPNAQPPPPHTYTYTLITHNSPTFHHTHLQTLPLSLKLIQIQHTGTGLLKKLRLHGTPVLGRGSNAQSIGGIRLHGVYACATRLQIPSLHVDVSVALPAKFERVKQRLHTIDIKREMQLQITRNATNVIPFCGYNFHVGAQVFIPRESSEMLVGTAVKYVRRRFAQLVKQAPNGVPAQYPHVVDLGCGSGALLISTLLHANVGATGSGVDICTRAVESARGNAERLGVDVDIIHGDWSAIKGRADVVICNPPYLKEHQLEDWIKDMPKQSTVGEYSTLSTSIAPWCREGVLVLEVGGKRGFKQVEEAFRTWSVAERIWDCKGFERCLVLTQNVKKR